MNVSLAGRRVLVTRARQDSEQWAERLTALGASPVVFPCLVSIPITDDVTADALSRALHNATWLVVTSPRAARNVARLMDTALPPQLHIAAVGPSTADMCRSVLGRSDLTAPQPTSASLGHALGDLLVSDGQNATARVVVVGAVDGRTDVEAALAKRGISHVRIDVYRTLPSPPAVERLDLATLGIDDVLLASPSAVQGLVNTARVPGETRIVTIGPTTSVAAAAAGLRVFAEARHPTLEGMLEELL